MAICDVLNLLILYCGTRTREPDAEDTEERALLRKQFAQAASIEGKQVLKDSKALKVSAFSQKINQLLDILSRPQHARKMSPASP